MKDSSCRDLCGQYTDHGLLNTTPFLRTINWRLHPTIKIPPPRSQGCTIVQIAEILTSPQARFPARSLLIFSVKRKEHRCSRNIFPEDVLVWCPFHRSKYQPFCRLLGQGSPAAVPCGTKSNVEHEREARSRRGGVSRQRCTTMFTTKGPGDLF